ncbi:putative short-chain dehydrogenase [Xylariomycetidae sp. FL0641]|nr:putative short-chain dehydrogenase [Xylariomycetidae sp. FL0641]
MTGGTIILTGANGSVGLHAAEQLLRAHPGCRAVFTVRDGDGGDAHTARLRALVARYPEARAASVHQVDLADLRSVHAFADVVARGVAAGAYPPLRALVCAAAYWNLVARAGGGGPGGQTTVDGFDKTLQVAHVAHAALVLRLLGSFAADADADDDDGGGGGGGGGSCRVVLLSSEGHFRRPNTMTSLLPDIPADLDELNSPPTDGDPSDRGFQRYGTAKLVLTTWMYALNRYLEQNPRLRHITAVAVNPGGLGDSRVFATNTPVRVRLLQRLVMVPFMGLINRLSDRTFRSAAAGAADVVRLAVGDAHPGERGYFTMLDPDESDPLTRDRDVQDRVWRKTLQWARITPDNTALKEAFE